MCHARPLQDDPYSDDPELGLLPAPAQPQGITISIATHMLLQERVTCLWPLWLAAVCLKRALLPTSALRLLLDFLAATRGWQQQHLPPQQPQQPHAPSAKTAAAGDATSNDGAAGPQDSPDSWQWWMAQLRSSFHTQHALDSITACSQGSASKAAASRAAPDAPSMQHVCSPGSSRAYVDLLLALSQAWGDVHDPSMATKASSITTGSTTGGSKTNDGGRRRGPAVVGVSQQAYLSCMLVWVLRRLRRSE
eukprot:scaffold197131_cov21-Tisochrysis_lutea.AAC.1